MSVAASSIIDIFANTLTGDKYQCVLKHFTDWGPAAKLAAALGQDIANQKLKSIKAGDETTNLIAIEGVVCKLTVPEINKLRGQIYDLFGNRVKAQKYGIKYAPASGDGEDTPPDLTPTKTEQNTMLYVAVGALILLVALKR